jgi:hypothetical protein
MAIYYARKSGNVNAADVWATTPTGVASDVFSSFTNQDTLVSNSFTITLNVNTTVAEIRNDTTGGATNGGVFNFNSGTLTAFINGNSSNTTLLAVNNNLDAYIIGNVACGSLMSGNGIVMSLAGPGSLYITGNLYHNGVSGGYCTWSNSIIKTINITGNIFSISGRAVFRIDGAPIINIIGNVVGPCFYYYSSSPSFTLNIIGSVTSSKDGGLITYAFSNMAGNFTITRVKGNDFGPGSVGVASHPGITAQQNTIVKVYEIEFGSLGQSPTSGPIELIESTSNVAVFATRLGLPKTLVDLNNSTNLVPTSGNVRSGISYNYGNNTGTCVIPNPSSVVYGVPVDNTIGSGLLSPVAIWNALTNAIGTAGSIGERLKNVSTVSTVGKQLEGVL